MTPLSKALDEIEYIPRAILEAAFLNETEMVTTHRTVEEEIVKRVIRKRVIGDCDLYGGELKYIPVNDTMITQITDTASTFTVPAKVVLNRTIVSPLALLHMDSNTMRYSQSQDGSIGGSASGLKSMGCGQPTVLERALDESMMRDIRQHPPVANTHLTMRGHNVILVEHMKPLARNYYIKAYISNDPNMENINRRLIPLFAELCLLATEAKVYTELALGIGFAGTYGGGQLSEFSNFVERYAESNEKYKDLIKKKWKKTSNMSQPKYMHNFVRQSFLQK